MSFDDEFDMLLNNINFSNINKTSKNNMNDRFCFSCNSENFYDNHSEGTLVCIDCGCTVENVVSVDVEDGFMKDDKVSRLSPISSMYQNSSTGTQIKMKYDNPNIRRVLQWDIPYNEKVIYTKSTTMENICNKFNIPKKNLSDANIFSVEIGKCKHENGNNKGKKVIIRGINPRSLLMNCLFQACKKNDYSFSPKEISSMFGIEKKKFKKGNKIFVKYINKTNVNYNLDPSEYEHFIKRYFIILGISDEYKDICYIICKNIRRFNIASSHNPHSVAAGIMYFLCEEYGLNLKKKKSSELFNISEVTISKIYKIAKENKTLICNDDLADPLHKLYLEKTSRLRLPSCLLRKYDEYLKIQEKCIFEVIIHN